jgi:DNA-binding NtrC family response regulator
MVFDAVSQHRDRVLSMDSFLDGIGRRDVKAEESEEGKNPFAGVEPLPDFDRALELLIDEAMERADGNQTQAARLLGITQSALSKRLSLRK